ncbi:hypothetical protein OG21DRAFT_1121144 [Imleria badia]|nr:hypothetical protein OG21DRAFT_1121144 [Imleria badia]
MPRLNWPLEFFKLQSGFTAFRFAIKYFQARGSELPVVETLVDTSLLSSGTFFVCIAACILDSLYVAATRAVGTLDRDERAILTKLTCQWIARVMLRQKLADEKTLKRLKQNRNWPGDADTVTNHRSSPTRPQSC